MKNKLLKQK